MKWVQKYSDVTETKHGTVELSLQLVFEMNVSKANRANIITDPVLIQKNFSGRRSQHGRKTKPRSQSAEPG